MKRDEACQFSHPDAQFREENSARRSNVYFFVAVVFLLCRACMGVSHAGEQASEWSSSRMSQVLELPVVFRSVAEAVEFAKRLESVETVKAFLSCWEPHTNRLKVKDSTYPIRGRITFVVGGDRADLLLIFTRKQLNGVSRMRKADAAFISEFVNYHKGEPESTEPIVISALFTRYFATPHTFDNNRWEMFVNVFSKRKSDPDQWCCTDARAIFSRKDEAKLSLNFPDTNIKFLKPSAVFGPDGKFVLGLFYGFGSSAEIPPNLEELE